MPKNDQPAGALAGIRVLDFSRVFAGPLCTMPLGDLGADVIKIERPGSGDDTRAWGPPFLAGESAYYLGLNRNKRSVTLNLTSDRGREIARALAAHADIVVENFRVGWMAEQGLDYETLRPKNAGLIYASITGYGQTGPDAHLPGYDFLAQARGGLMSITGDADGPPTKVGVAVSDLIAGLYAATGILAALHARKGTGEGQYLDISLLDSTVASLANVAGNFLAEKALDDDAPAPGRLGNEHPNIVPYQIFRASDGDFALAVGNDAQWRRCAEAINHPEWAGDPRFATNADRVSNREVLTPLLAQVFGTRPAREWIDLLQEAKVPASLVQDVAQVCADLQVQARGLITSVAHPLIGALSLVGSPLRLSADPVEVRRAPPTLGQHTAEALGELLGIDAAELAVLRREGVV